MDQKTFEAILTLLVPQVIDLIVKNYGLDEISATKAFYESKLYSVLEEEDTKAKLSCGTYQKKLCCVIAATVSQYLSNT